MNLHKKVLPRDLKMAIKLYKCCHTCLRKSTIYFKKDNLDQADWWMNEFHRCKRELDKLLEKKVMIDKRKKFIQKLIEEGHNVEMIFWEGRKRNA